MARRLIGLDIGTNAVTVAEVRAGNPPRLEMFGQVALGRETMREGEVADDAAVTEAVGRLRAEVGLKKVSVRLGLASPRVVVRQIEMPLMSREELGSALQFQAAELIPIPLDDAVLDFAILGPAAPGSDGEQRMHVLLAAVQEATVSRLVAAVQAGGLQVSAVDLVPLALIRPLARAVPDLALVGAGAGGDPGTALADGVHGAEGIVSFGGGVTAIAVHEGGVPRFVRVLGTGGRELTDAIASELDLPPETAEALKRQLGSDGNDELVARARASIERPLSVLLDEVRSSIDYYRNQSGSSPLLRIVVTGGGAQLPGLSERLSALVGVPVEQARPRELIALGDIGFSEEELPRLDPYLPAAVGLALGGAGVGTVINLQPHAKQSVGAIKRAKIAPGAVAAAAAVVVLLGGLTVMAKNNVSHAKSQRTAVEEQASKLNTELATFGPVLQRQAKIDTLATDIKTLLATDVAWEKMINRITTHLPPGISLVSFQGTSTPPVPVAAVTPPASTDTSGSTTATTTVTTTPTTVAPPAVVNGTITFQGKATDFPTVAAWIDSMSKVPEIADIYVSSVQRVAAAADGTGGGVTFSATAVAAPAANSNRVGTYVKAAR
jgi:type IV pilus assembly protein PilM